MPILSTFIQQTFGSFSHGKQKKMKQKESKLENKQQKSQFSHDMILYIENLNSATRKPLELINEFFMVTEGKTEKMCYISTH